MKSPTVQRLLETTPEEVKEKVDQYAERLTTYNIYKEWCEKTGRNAGVMGPAIKEFCEYLDSIKKHI